MAAKKVIIVIATLVLYFSSMASSQEYHAVKIWPEMPQGWHFYNPRAIAVDNSGNVYVGDSGNYCIKKFDADGRFITEWGSPGQGDGQFNSIRVVMVSNSGTVYVSDEHHDEQAGPTRRIQEFTPYGQFIGQFERKTPDVNKASLTVDVAKDDQGNIFLLSVDFIYKDARIRHAMIEKYSPNGEFLAQCLMDAGSGDGQLQIPSAIAIDAEGNIYVTDCFDNRVQKFDPSGKFLLKWGTHGDGDGRFNWPNDIAIGGSGDVYVRDSYAIQKFTSDGKFLARWKTKGGGGIALDSNSNIYVTCGGSHKILKLNSAGKTVAEWGNAYTENGRFVEPGSIAVNSSGCVVVADSWNYCIQKFTDEGLFLSKWGGYTDTDVWDLATDTSGNLYAALVDANEVQKFDPQGKLICRWGCSGSGDGQFSWPKAIAIGPSDKVYVADSGNNRVQKFTSNGKFLAKWGTKGIGDGQFDKPFLIAADRSGHVWVGDQLSNGTHRMQKFDANGKFLATWTRKIMTAAWPVGHVGAMAADSAGNSYYAFEDHIEKYDADGKRIDSYGQEGFTKDELGQVWAICVDQSGCLYTTGPADPCTHSVNTAGCIRKFDGDGKLISKWTGQNAEGKGEYPNGPITVDQAGNIYALQWTSPSIQKLASDGRQVAEFPIAVSHEGSFAELGGVTVDRSGNIFAVDSVDVGWEWGIPSIKEFDPNGQITRTLDLRKTAPGKLKYPSRIAVDGSGNMYVTDQNSQCVHKLDAQGDYIKSWGEKGTGDGQFDTPAGIAVDGAGHIYVCDRQNCRIQKFDSDGKFLAKWGKIGSGDGEFHFPAAVAVDKDGNVFIADSDNHRVQKFTADGKFLTKWGQFGEGPGQLNVPLGIAVDEAGNVYVSDSHNQRIQKFAPTYSR